MCDEIASLLDVTDRLEAAGIDYMLTGSMALNFYAMPRMTRDIDLVATVVLADEARIESIFPANEFYVAAQAMREAVLGQTSFNLIHLATMTKIDIMVRKNDNYHRWEFSRRCHFTIRGKNVAVVSKEDLVLAKLSWARESSSERQLADVRNLLASGCDMDYLQTWAKRLNLNDILTRILA
jgi:hypothetical protein